jgi:signal transduction histidine kinase
LWPIPLCVTALYADFVVTDALRSLLAEPRAPAPPVRVWRDWALVAVLVAAALLEGILREEVAWRPVAIAMALTVIVLLLWRRTSPLAVVATAFGTITAIGVAALVAGDEAVGLDTTACVLLLPYALFRWGSGREAATGLIIMLVAAVVAIAGDPTGVVDAVFGTMFLLFLAVLGASVRYRATARLREFDQVKLREREQLARELHDTVAHHVSAIAIQAQAGQTVARSDPDGAVNALEVIEEAASRTLAEMREMVGVLREAEEPDLAPQRGVADIERLARVTAHGPRVAVTLTGDLDELRPSVGAAMYRLAQESITNALRHARNATRIDVCVAGERDAVRLTVRDDGEAGAAGRDPSGYGLVGMTERATLLGGSLEAGPAPGRGWTVSAVLPRASASA